MRDRIHETKLFNNRVAGALVTSLLLMLAIVVRLVYLEVVNHDYYTTLSQNNRISTIAIPPPRGLIYDRNGVIFAQNLPSFSLEIVPEEVRGLEATLSGLKQIITIEDSDIRRFRRMLNQKRNTKGVPLRFRLSEEEVAHFAINRPRFPGVDVVAGQLRHYPLESLAVHAVGYVGRINEEEITRLDPSKYSGTTHIGKTGVEKYYEDVLHGEVGFEQIETNAQGRRLRVLKHIPPTAGRNLYLTLDIKLQALAEEALGDNRGAIVALDPKTGAVLALASMPGYDPNLFVNGIDTEEYEALAKSLDQPLFNRALRGLYPPGSTLKPFVGLGGLELNQVSLEHNNFCPGFYALKGQPHKYRDWKHSGHGKVDLDKAIVESCDVYFYNLAQAMGIDRLYNFLSQFGFGSRTRIDVSGEVAGLLPSREWKRRVRHQPWFPGETLITGIGQGYVLATPLQLASATATLANRGVRMQPKIVLGMQDPQSPKIIPQAPATLNALPIGKAADWSSVTTAMTRVVHSAHGTARAIGVGAPYTIAGKTGTAQVFGIKQDARYSKDKVAERLRDHALFIAFAPAEQPRIAVAVIVENGSHGATAAAPLARKVMDQYLSSYPLQVATGAR